MVDAVLATLPPKPAARHHIARRPGTSAPDETCELLGVSEANQRVLLHRARGKVRSAMEDYVGKSGGRERMIEPDLRCVEFVELVTDWTEGALDDATVARFRGAPRLLRRLR